MQPNNYFIHIYSLNPLINRECSFSDPLFPTQKNDGVSVILTSAIKIFTSLFCSLKELALILLFLKPHTLLNPTVK